MPKTKRVKNETKKQNPSYLLLEEKQAKKQENNDVLDQFSIFVSEFKNRLIMKEHNFKFKTANNMTEKQKKVYDPLNLEFSNDVENRKRFKKLQRISKRLSNYDKSPKLDELPCNSTTKITSTISSDSLDILPYNIVFGIMYYLSQYLFEEIVFSCVNKLTRKIYENNFYKFNCQRIGCLYSTIGNSAISNTDPFVSKANFLTLQAFLEFGILNKRINDSIILLFAITRHETPLFAFAESYPMWRAADVGKYLLQDNYYATRIVAVQPRKLVYKLIDTYFHNENLYSLLSYIVFELIVCNKVPQEIIANEATRFYREKMSKRNHEFSFWPVTLLPIESGITGPTKYSRNVYFEYQWSIKPELQDLISSNFPEPSPLQDNIKRAIHDPRPKFSVKDITTLDDMKNIWPISQQFYKHEITILQVLDQRIFGLTPDDIFCVVADANLTCMTGLFQVDFDALSHKLISAFDAFGHIFLKAANGAKCRGDCSSGSMGRINAWKAMATLIGISYKKENLEQIEEESKHCVFLQFKGTRLWWKVSSDNVGLAVMRRDKKTIAVFALKDREL